MRSFSTLILLLTTLSSLLFSNSGPLVSTHSIPVSLYSHIQRYPFTINGITTQIPIATNRKITHKAPEVERLILAIHSSSYNPDAYLNNVLDISRNYPGLQKKLLILSPALYRKDKTKLQDILVWNTAPFWGSSRGLITSQKVNISAYEVLDHLLMSIILSGNFPHLKQIVILGHSAGGQLVNRYAASNTIEETFNIPVKYMVMAPSSYLYFTDERICDKREKKFCKLKEKDKQLNRWGYGTEKLYGYHKRHHITPHSMKRRYQHATILYLVGENDDKRDASLSTHIGAMAQGNHRKERAMIYYNYLQHLFGSDITRNQKLVIVPNVGHWGKGLMRSREGTQFILFD